MSLEGEQDEATDVGVVMLKDFGKVQCAIVVEGLGHRLPIDYWLQENNFTTVRYLYTCTMSHILNSHLWWSTSRRPTDQLTNQLESEVSIEQKSWRASS